MLSRAMAAGLAMFATLGIAAKPADSQALHLQSGDNVTVSSSGTSGTYQGQLISNGTHTYSDAGNVAAAVDCEGTAAFQLSGGTLNVTKPDIGLFGKGTGTVMITGGAITAAANGAAVEIIGSSPVTVTGGTLSAGQGGFGLFARGAGPVALTGGVITTGAGGFGLAVDGSGLVTVTGGVISVGTGGYGLITDDGGTIDLFGSSFTYTPDGKASQTVSAGFLPLGTGMITGTLQNGDTLTTAYSNEATIEINVIAPEPSQWAALGLGFLGVSALALRARRRAVTGG